MTESDIHTTLLYIIHVEYESQIFCSSLQSAGSSPGIVRKPFCAETSVAAFKRVLEGPTPAEREAEEKRRREFQGRRE